MIDKPDAGPTIIAYSGFVKKNLKPLTLSQSEFQVYTNYKVSAEILYILMNPELSVGIQTLSVPG